MILNRKWTGAMVERLHHGSKGWRWEPHPLTVGVCDMPTSKEITLSSLWSQLAIVDNGVKGLINPILKMIYALVLVPCAHWLYWLFFHSCKVHSNKIWYQMDTISWTPELRSGESCIGYLDRLFALAVQILHSHCGGEISVSFLPGAQWAGFLALPQRDIQFPCKMFGWGLMSILIPLLLRDRTQEWYLFICTLMLNMIHIHEFGAVHFEEKL